MRRTTSQSLLPGWMMTMPGALITGLAIAFFLRQFFVFVGDVNAMMTAQDYAPQCFKIPQKLIVEKNIPDSYRGRQKQSMIARLRKEQAELVELSTLCLSGNCTNSNVKRLHKVFRNYIRSRAMRYKYANEFTGSLGPQAFRDMYETRNEALLKELVLKLHKQDILNLRNLSGYDQPARMFLYKRPEDFVACS